VKVGIQLGYHDEGSGGEGGRRRRRTREDQEEDEDEEQEENYPAARGFVFCFGPKPS
jgi:hypothetical protein